MAASIANFLAIGKMRSHQIGCDISNNLSMDNTKDILASNLKTLKAHYALTNLKMAKRCGVANGTIDRALRAVGAIDIDVLTKIASAFHLFPWQLLIADLNPTNPWHVCNISPEEEALYNRLRSALKT